MFLAILLTASACTVTDGDTIRCGDERIRLLGIDAPEIHRCRKGRVCVPGDGQASKRNLERIAREPVRIERVGKDRYGRSLAQVYSRGVNLACAQIRAGQAVYVERWDDGKRLASECAVARATP